MAAKEQFDVSSQFAAANCGFATVKSRSMKVASVFAELKRAFAAVAKGFASADHYLNLPGFQMNLRRAALSCAPS